MPIPAEQLEYLRGLDLSKPLPMEEYSLDDAMVAYGAASEVFERMACRLVGHVSSIAGESTTLTSVRLSPDFVFIKSVFTQARMYVQKTMAKEEIDIKDKSFVDLQRFLRMVLVEKKTMEGRSNKRQGMMRATDIEMKDMSKYILNASTLNVHFNLSW